MKNLSLILLVFLCSCSKGVITNELKNEENIERTSVISQNDLSFVSNPPNVYDYQGMYIYNFDYYGGTEIRYFSTMNGALPRFRVFDQENEKKILWTSKS